MKWLEQRKRRKVILEERVLVNAVVPFEFNFAPAYVITDGIGEEALVFYFRASMLHLITSNLIQVRYLKEKHYKWLNLSQKIKHNFILELKKNGKTSDILSHIILYNLKKFGKLTLDDLIRKVFLLILHTGHAKDPAKEIYFKLLEKFSEQCDQFDFDKGEDTLFKFKHPSFEYNPAFKEEVLRENKEVETYIKFFILEHIHNALFFANLKKELFIVGNSYVENYHIS